MNISKSRCKNIIAETSQTNYKNFCSPLRLQVMQIFVYLSKLAVLVPEFVMFSDMLPWLSFLVSSNPLLMSSKFSYFRACTSCSRYMSRSWARKMGRGNNGQQANLFKVNSWPVTWRRGELRVGGYTWGSGYTKNRNFPGGGGENESSHFFHNPQTEGLF